MTTYLCFLKVSPYLDRHCYVGYEIKIVIIKMDHIFLQFINCIKGLSQNSQQLLLKFLPLFVPINFCAMLKYDDVLTYLLIKTYLFKKLVKPKMHNFFL